MRILFPLVLAAFIYGCGPSGGADKGAKGGKGGPMGGMPPAQVAVVAVEPKSLPVTYEYTGQTLGSREVEVRARVTGILQERNFKEGGPVKKGQSLFTIDPAPFIAAAVRAEADVSGAEARLAQARKNAARLKPLFAEKAVSQKEYDDSTSAEAIADADLKAARARLTEARLNLLYTKVESPVSGIAGRAQRSDGSLVSGPDVLLTTVTQIDPIWVSFGVPDNEQLRINNEVAAGRLELPKGGSFDVAVKLADGTVYPQAGKLNFSDVRISNATGTSETRAELPNPKGALRPGQFVRVTLKGATRPNAITVPQRAVLEGPQGKFVYVLAQGKAEARPVQVAEWTGEDWIVTSGLKAGEQVIVDGVMKLAPGAPVQVGQPENKKEQEPKKEQEKKK
ncbi:MAG TPA: efflux RND transporter periplasmic adaptor subunit [Burkholderiales bacterium]|jgi:membrane fusion protein (multidrug efflux system)|nr:efflux RND transporter periplasmic adaptor subunit [Burkholderiales bacterium]